MKRAIRNHWRDVVAMIGLVIIAVGVGGYILSNQRLRFPFLEEEPYAVWIELPNAQGVTPGQGQTVRVAGMQVGDIGKVELAGGVARVRMDLEVEYDDLVHTDATVLLRPRTGLKDMFLALDPGTHAKPVVKEGGTIGVGNALPDVNQDEILAMLDADTRAYLKLLVNGAGGGLRNRGGDLREVFRRLGPLHRDLAVLNSEVVKRKRNLARLVHNYGGTIDRLGREDAELAALVSGQSKVFTRLAREDARISEAVRRLPGTLAQTEKTLGKVNELGRVVGPALDAMRPAVRQLDEANKRAASAGREGRAGPARERAPARARGPPVPRRRAPGRHEPRQGEPRPAEVVLRAQPLLQHGVVQPRRPREADGELQRRPRAPGGLPVLGGLGGAQLQLAVLDRRRVGPVPPRAPRRQLHHLPRDARPGRCRGAAPRAGARHREAARRPRPLPALVNKDPLTRGQMAAVAGFTASVVCLLLYLWIAFGGATPLRPEGYRVQVQFDEAALLVEQADVRIAGLNVGKVATKTLDEGASVTVAELEIDDEYAPIPRDSRATLRQKGLLGETYVELSPGTSDGPQLEDGDMLPTGAAQETVEIDEIVKTFDKPTREAFQGWVKELAASIDKGRGESLNDALGNLPGFVARGDDVLRVLNEERPVLGRLVRNGGRALGAVNERQGQLRELIVNADEFFGALNSRNDALADTVFVLPTFLDETKATLSRLRTFSTKAAPLMRDLTPVAEDLRPTLARHRAPGARPEGLVQEPRPDHRRVGAYPACRARVS